MKDIISREGIGEYLKNPAHSDRIFVYESLVSTNITASELADSGLDGVVIANSQTGGMGRMGRSFYSPADTGIYMSLVLRPDCKAEDMMLITTAAGVAVCFALENMLGLTPGLKWVNDVLLNGKKICGISAQSKLKGDRPDYVVLGIGLNVGTVDFPEEIKASAGSLASSGAVSRNGLIAEILNHLFEIMEDFENRAFLEDYRKRSVVLGRQITILPDGLEAEAAAIDDRGGLVVRFPDGRIEHIISGEVSIRGDFYRN